MTVSNQDDSIRQLFIQITKALVDDSNAVQVDCSDKEGVTIFEIRVAPDDLGKVIGREGRTARSLRTLLSASGTKLQRRFALDIEERGL